MSASRWIWIALAVVILMAGCRMCSHRLDYCGPTVGGDSCGSGCGGPACGGSCGGGCSGSCGEACDPMARAGSILVGMRQAPPEPAMVVPDGYVDPGVEMPEGEVYSTEEGAVQEYLLPEDAAVPAAPVGAEVELLPEPTSYEGWTVPDRTRSLPW